LLRSGALQIRGPGLTLPRETCKAMALVFPDAVRHSSCRSAAGTPVAAHRSAKSYALRCVRGTDRR
ncbi:MAG TPA: hypothetical protein VN838_19515, partial [Bradyrhizobium sp.]|nr:hypothetical protein [Bradyrhizobium sp.]